MTTSPVPLASLETTVGKVVSHLREQRDTALVAAPGCGATTMTRRIEDELNGYGIRTFNFDLQAAKAISDPINQLHAVPAAAGPEDQRILIIDHAANLSQEDFKIWIENVSQKAPEIGAACLWVGSLDARGILDELGTRIHAIPKSHITFPVLPRDETLAAYRAIAEANDCRWGEAILFLLFDFCGNDLSLVRGAAEYLYGDWTDKLYDASIWDRIEAWLANDSVVNTYRERLNSLSEPCREYLALMRLGGKPPCPRPELLEEVEPALRHLCLQGFLIHNFLPGFYQLRHLTIQFLLHEQAKPWDGYRPEILFRRATNDRAARLLQDSEVMLRSVLRSVFQRLGETEVRTLLEKKHGDQEFIPIEFHRALLNWAEGTNGLKDSVYREVFISGDCEKAAHKILSEEISQAVIRWLEKRSGEVLKQSLNALILQHRDAFRKDNSIWARVTRMMKADGYEADTLSIPEHLGCIDYLTLNELEVIVIDLLDEVFPGIASNDLAKRKLKERWQETLSKLKRLRNRVAHLRNVGFQDMEDLVGTIGDLRKSLIAYGGWR
jgi:hypothetical protein